MNTRLPVATAVVVAPAAVGCGASSQDPAAVLTAYEVARNAGDVATASAFFADDAVLNGHPLDQRQRLENWARASAPDSALTPNGSRPKPAHIGIYATHFEPNVLSDMAGYETAHIRL